MTKSTFDSNKTLVSLPALPNFFLLRIFLLVSASITSLAFLLPVTLSLKFTGRIASNGPTNTISAPSDSIIEITANENARIGKGDALFKFRQPVLLARINMLETKEKTLTDLLVTSRQECNAVEDSYKLSLKHAQQVFKLKKDAFDMEAISQLNLLSSRTAIDSIQREIAVNRQRCSQEKNKLEAERTVVKEEIAKEKAANQLIEVINAPADGYMHRVSIKSGQKVSSGQLLASFTSDGTTGAELLIPLRDRPFITMGDQYLVTSDSYQILANPPVRACTVTAISPDSFVDGDTDAGTTKLPTFTAKCEFDTSPLMGEYPFLVGMQINATTTSVRATLVQILIDGYSRLMYQNQ